MTMGMTGRRVPSQRRLMNQVSHISKQGPYYSTDAGGRANRVARRSPLGFVPDWMLPSGGTQPLQTGIPAVDQFLSGFGAMLGATTPPSPSLPGMPGLPAFRLPSGLQDLIYAMPVEGMFTPWAGQISDLNWQEIASPTANIASMAFGQISLALENAAAGRPGFVAFLAAAPVPLALVQAAFTGTPYRYADTQAVYSQQDTGSPPKLLFMHWGSLRDPSDPTGGAGNVEVSAASIGAKAIFALPVSTAGTTIRTHPKGFAAAYKAQFGVTPFVEPTTPLPQPSPSQPPGVPAPTTPNIPSQPTPGTVQPGQPSMPGGVQASSAMGGALVWGLGALALSFGVVYLVKTRGK